MSFLSSFLKGSNKPNESKIDLVHFQYFGRNKINMNPLKPKACKFHLYYLISSFPVGYDYETWTARSPCITFPLWFCIEAVSNFVENMMSYVILGNNRICRFLDKKRPKKYYDAKLIS